MNADVTLTSSHKVNGKCITYQYQSVCRDKYVIRYNTLILHRSIHTDMPVGPVCRVCRVCRSLLTGDVLHVFHHPLGAPVQPQRVSVAPLRPLGGGR